MSNRVRGPRYRKLGLEGLEDRSLMAVFTSAGGMLNIIGTGNDNVVVRQQANGQLQVSVNGGATFGNAGVVSSIFANLGAGDDTLTIGEPSNFPAPSDPVTLLGNVIVYMGDGNDTANIRVNTLGSVMIDGGYQFLGSENDTVNVDGSFINSLVVNTWGGNDTLAIDSSIILSLSANLGVGQLSTFRFFGSQTDNDTLDVTASVLGNTVATLGTAQANGGNFVDVSSTLFGGLTILGGDRRDSISIDSAGPGIGANLGSQIVSLVDDLEPFIQGLLSRLPANQVLPNLDMIFSRLDGMVGNLPFDLDRLLDGLQNVNPRQIDLSNAVAVLLSGVNLSPIGDTTIGGSLVISTLGGNDGVDLTDSVFLANAMVLLGAGNDHVFVQNVGALLVYLDGGSGNGDAAESLAEIFAENPLLGPGRVIRTGFEFSDLPV